MGPTSNCRIKCPNIETRKQHERTLTRMCVAAATHLNWQIERRAIKQTAPKQQNRLLATKLINGMQSICVCNFSFAVEINTGNKKQKQKQNVTKCDEIFFLSDSIWFSWMNPRKYASKAMHSKWFSVPNYLKTSILATLFGKWFGANFSITPNANVAMLTHTRRSNSKKTNEKKEALAQCARPYLFISWNGF